MFHLCKLNFVLLVCILWYYVQGSEVNDKNYVKYENSSIGSFGTSRQTSDRLPRSRRDVTFDVIFRDEFLLLIVRADLVPIDVGDFPSYWQDMGEDSVDYYVNRERLVGDYYLKDVEAMRRFSNLDRYFLKFQMSEGDDPTIWNCVSFVYVESIGNVVDAAHCECRNDFDAYRFHDIENCNEDVAALGLKNFQVLEIQAREVRLAKLGALFYFKEVPLESISVQVNEVSGVVSNNRFVYSYKTGVTFKNGTSYDCILVAYNGLFDEGLYTNMSVCKQNLLQISIEKSIKEVLEVNHNVSRYQAETISVHVKALDLVHVRRRYRVKFQLRDVETGDTNFCETVVDTVKANQATVIAAMCDGIENFYGSRIVRGMYNPQRIDTIEGSLFEQNLALVAISRYSSEVEFKEKSIKIFEVVKDGSGGDEMSRSVIKFRAADLSGVWYDCIAVAVYDSNYNRSDVTVVDCRNRNYTGRGVFPVDEFREKFSHRFPSVIKSEYGAVNNSEMYCVYEFVGGRCLNYYRKTEEHDDGHKLMDVSGLLIKDVYKGTQYQYFVSFLIRNNRTGEILSCVATAFAGTKHLKGLLVNAAHCKDRIDSDAHRFESVVIPDAPKNAKNKPKSGSALYNLRRNCLKSLKKKLDDITEHKFISVGVGLLSDSVLSKLRDSTIEYYQQRQRNPYVLYGIKDVFRKLVYNGEHYQYLLTVEMKNNDTGEWTSCAVSLFSRSNHRLMFANAAHCNCRNDTDAYRFNYSCKAATVARTTTAPSAETSNSSIVEPHVQEMILAQKASFMYFSIDVKDAYEFGIVIKKVLRKYHEGRYRYKLLYRLATPTKYFFNCFALGRLNIDYTDYHIDIVDCRSANEWFPGKGLINKKEYDSAPVDGETVVKTGQIMQSGYSEEYADASLRHYMLRQSIVGNTSVKEVLEMYGTHESEIRQFHYVLNFSVYYFKLYFQNWTLEKTEELWNCTSSIYADDRKPSSFMVSAVHCLCKNDTDSYRFKDKENCITITTPPPPTYKNSIGFDNLPLVHHMKLARMAAKRYFSIKHVKSFWFNIVEDLQHFLDGILRIEEKIKFRAKTPDGTLYDCFMLGRVSYIKKSPYKIINYYNYIVDTVNCGRNWYADEEEYSRRQLRMHHITLDGKIVQSYYGETYANESVKHYKNKERLNGDYYLVNVTDIHERMVSVEEVQYRYIVRFLMRGHDQELWNCASLVFQDYARSVIMVSAVHCACRNDSDAYIFKEIDKCSYVER